MYRVSCPDTINILIIVLWFQHPRWTTLRDPRYLRNPPAMDGGHYPHPRVLLTSTGNNSELVLSHKPKFNIVMTTFPLADVTFCVFTLKLSLRGVIRNTLFLIPILEIIAIEDVGYHITQSTISGVLFSWFHWQFDSWWMSNMTPVRFTLRHISN